MELILWRHADAEDAGPGDADAARALTGKGKKQARRMAAWLRQRLPEDARVLASPAKRAQQTAWALTGRFETIAEAGTGGGPQAILQAAGWPEVDATVVVVGHQPTLGQVVALALTGKASDWSIKKGAIWWIESRARGGAAVLAVVSPDLLK